MIYKVIDYDYSVYTGQVRVLVQIIKNDNTTEFHTIHFAITNSMSLKEVQDIIEERIKVKDGSLNSIFMKLENLSWNDVRE